MVGLHPSPSYLVVPGRDGSLCPSNAIQTLAGTLVLEDLEASFVEILDQVVVDHSKACCCRSYRFVIPIQVGLPGAKLIGQGSR